MIDSEAISAQVRDKLAPFFRKLYRSWAIEIDFASPTAKASSATSKQPDKSTPCFILRPICQWDDFSLIEAAAHKGLGWENDAIVRYGIHNQRLHISAEQDNKQHNKKVGFGHGKVGFVIEELRGYAADLFRKAKQEQQANQPSQLAQDLQQPTGQTQPTALTLHQALEQLLLAVADDCYFESATPEDLGVSATSKQAKAPDCPLNHQVEVVGYICLSHQYCLEIDNVTVSPAYQGMGFGKLLVELAKCLLTMPAVEQLKQQPTQDRAAALAYFCEEPQVVLEVRRSNAKAIRVYEKCGLKLDGCRKNYYRHSVRNAETGMFENFAEDALLMSYIAQR